MVSGPSGVYICKSIVNDLIGGNYICKSEGIHLAIETVRGCCLILLHTSVQTHILGRVEDLTEGRRLGYQVDIKPAVEHREIPNRG
jgi:hypothetical protein